jgi:PGF-pre-PGF domain-containing protein
VVAGEETTMTIDKEDIVLIGIDFTLGEDAKSTSVTVSSLKSNPVPSIGAPSGKVYQYLQISSSNAPNVESVTLSFKVENSWLVENGLGSEEVAMYRLVGTDWVELPTSMLRSDGQYTYFEAQSSGFSYFAVGGRGTTAPEPEPVTSVSGETVRSVSTITEPSPDVVIAPSEPEFILTPTERSTLKWFVISGVLMSLALFVVAYEYFKHNVFVPHHEKEARKYVLRARSRGRTDGQIKTALKKADWPDKKVQKLLKKK